MADIPANHQRPEEFTPTRPDETTEVPAPWSAEQWAAENDAALKAEAEVAALPVAIDEFEDGAPVAPSVPAAPRTRARREG